MVQPSAMAEAGPTWVFGRDGFTFPRLEIFMEKHNNMVIIDNNLKVALDGGQM